MSDTETRPTLSGMQRRRFLQTMAAVGGAAAMPVWMEQIAAAATPIGANDGIVVHIMMEGGNDPLNTLIPVTNPAYYAARSGIAIQAQAALPLTADRALHAALPTLKQLYDQGHAAFIEGVGVPANSLSHFDSAARVESGIPTSTLSSTGWLGRYVDRLPGDVDGFHSVSIGSSVPLVATGSRSAASALPLNMPSVVRQREAEPYIAREFAALRALGSGGFGRGQLAEELADTTELALDVAGTIEALYTADGGDRSLANQLTMVARLINADLGIRVFTVTFGDFDTHADQALRHNAALSEFDDGIKAFYSILSERFAGRTLLYAMSEFGRRVKQNGSNGTDHGDAGLALAIGRRVKGGVYGALPSLTALDGQGNMIPTVDYRDVYSTIIGKWLGGNPADILNRQGTDLGFLRTPTTDSGPPPILAATTETRHRQIYNQVVGLYLAYFKRFPDEAGLEHWVQLVSGGLAAAEVSEAFAGSQEFVSRYGTLTNHEFVRLVYKNVLDRNPDAGGHDYWRSVLDKGATRGTVMLGFADSVEFVTKTKGDRAQIDRKGPIGRLYRAYFLREPDTDGLHHWISTGLPRSVVSQEFAQSPEFVARYGSLSQSEFVALVYNNVLARTPDGGGLHYWESRLESGLSRGEVMLGFSDSPEFVSKVSRS